MVLSMSATTDRIPSRAGLAGIARIMEGSCSHCIHIRELAQASAELEDEWAAVELNQDDKLVRLELLDNGYRYSF